MPALSREVKLPLVEKIGGGLEYGLPCELRGLPVVYVVVFNGSEPT